MSTFQISSDSIADPQAAGFDPHALARVRSALAGQVERHRLPGAVTMVVRHGRVACFDAIGRRDPAQPDAMARDAIFRIYSMTKPIVSVAAMMLFEQGRLQLADPVAKYLPAFGKTMLGVERENGTLDLIPSPTVMTVQDLLRHTSGLTYEFLEPSKVRELYSQARIFSAERNADEFCTALAALPLSHAPGRAWGYSRATDVLGHLIETITGEPLGAHLHRTIFEPLGMVDTGFWVPPEHQGRVAEPFARDPDAGAAVVLKDVTQPPRRESGGGGLVSTIADYARFLNLMMNGGTAGGTRLLGRKTVEFMTADHLGHIPVSGGLLPPGHGFGLGVAVRLQAGVGVMPGSAGTYGWGGIAGTTFFVDPQEGLFGVMMVQAPGQLDEFAALFRNLVYAALD